MIAEALSVCLMWPPEATRLSDVPLLPTGESSVHCARTWGESLDKDLEPCFRGIGISSLDYHNGSMFSHPIRDYPIWISADEKYIIFVNPREY